MRNELTEVTPAFPAHEITEKLRELLEYQLAGRSSSVEAETAQETLQSLLYVLAAGTGEKTLPAAWDKGMARLRRLRAKAEALQRRCETSLSPLATLACKETVRDGVPYFLKRYEPLFRAHITMPLSDHFDYPPLWEEGLAKSGALYVEGYLRQLCMENELLSRFPQKEAEALLERFSRHNGLPYRRMYCNLGAVLLDSGLICAALGMNMATLRMTQEQAAGLSGLEREALLERLRQAEKRLPRQLSLSAKAAKLTACYFEGRIPALADELLRFGAPPYLSPLRENAPGFTLQQGTRLNDAGLRALSKRMMETADSGEKLALLREHTAHLSDFVTLMDTSLFEGEYEPFFIAMEPMERLLLARAVFGGDAPEQSLEAGWRRVLWRLVSKVDR